MVVHYVTPSKRTKLIRLTKPIQLQTKGLIVIPVLFIVWCYLQHHITADMIDILSSSDKKSDMILMDVLLDVKEHGKNSAYCYIDFIIIDTNVRPCQYTYITSFSNDRGNQSSQISDLITFVHEDGHVWAKYTSVCYGKHLNRDGVSVFVPLIDLSNAASIQQYIPLIMNISFGEELKKELFVSRRKAAGNALKVGLLSRDERIQPVIERDDLER